MVALASIAFHLSAGFGTVTFLHPTSQFLVIFYRDCDHLHHAVVLLAICEQLASKADTYHCAAIWAIYWSGFFNVNYFGGVSWVSPFVNLIAIPWVSMFVVPAIFFALLMTLFFSNILFVTNTFVAPIWEVIDWGLAPVSYLLKLTQGAWLTVSANVGTLCFFLVILLILLRFRCYLTALVSGLVVMILMAFPVHIRPNWQIQVLDVGQGLAILLRKDGHSVLYDTGINWQGGSMANSIIAPLLNQDGEEQLSGLIISHTDSDHAGGRQDVEQQLNPIW